jgi:FkbM family methyltransferase
MEKITIEDGFIVQIDDNDWLAQRIKEYGVWEIHIKDFLHVNLTKNDVFLDVGSNYGLHTLTASQLCKEVHSFEPQKYIHDLQKETLSLNNIQNVKLYNIGLGNKEETTTLEQIDYTFYGVNMGDIGVKSDNRFSGEVIKIKTIDSLDLGKVDCIKLDVQGYEKFVIEGGKKTIKKYKPTLIVEAENNQLGKYDVSVSDLYSYIVSLGYFIFLLDWEYPVDVVCVHHTKLLKFLDKNNKYLSELTENFDISDCLNNGINKKLIYSTKTYHEQNRKKIY